MVNICDPLDTSVSPSTPSPWLQDHRFRSDQLEITVRNCRARATNCKGLFVHVDQGSPGKYSLKVIFDDI